MLDFPPSSSSSRHKHARMGALREELDPHPRSVSMHSERPDHGHEFTSVEIPGLVSPTHHQPEPRTLRAMRRVDLLMRFVLTVPGGFGAIWALFAATDTVVGVLLPDTPRLSADGLYVLVAFACSLLGGVGGLVSWVYNLEQARRQRADRRQAQA